MPVGLRKPVRKVPAASAAPPVTRRRLDDFLTPEQRAQKDMYGVFEITNVTTGNVWRISTTSVTGNITLVRVGDPKHPPVLANYPASVNVVERNESLCVYAVSYDPNACDWTDEAMELCHVAQYLSLTYDEEPLLWKAYK